jgi:hypothetical protein
MSHIINISEMSNIWEATGDETIKILRININDNPNVSIQNYFEKSHDFINKAFDENGAVLVHCFAGISRSSTIIISYLIKYCSMSLKDAFNHVLNIKKDICPNIGFFKQLQNFELLTKNIQEPSLSLIIYLKNKIYRIYGFNHDEIEKALIKNSLDESNTLKTLFFEKSL